MEIRNNIAYIDGTNGPYDGRVSNPSVRYGRNSYANFKSYLDQYKNFPDVKYPDFKNLKELSVDEFKKKLEETNNSFRAVDSYLNNLPPLNYERRYSPQNAKGALDGLALMGEAYEEMGEKTSMSVQELNAKMDEAFPNICESSVLDFNKDGEISLAEYSTTIVLSDILSTNSETPDIKSANGVVTKDGENKSLPYINKKNWDVANKSYRAIYDAYHLEDYSRQFVSDPNNLNSAR